MQTLKDRWGSKCSRELAGQFSRRNNTCFDNVLNERLNTLYCNEQDKILSVYTLYTNPHRVDHSQLTLVLSRLQYNSQDKLTQHGSLTQRRS